MMHNIDDCKDELISKNLKIVDIEPQGRAVHFEDENGRSYSIDFTGKDGAIVYVGLTDKEELFDLRERFDALLEKLDVSEEDLSDIIAN